MDFHRGTDSVRGAGSWDRTTLRYMPLTGGSRSRLPLLNDPDIRRYHGFVGVDEHLTAEMDSLRSLYSFLGGRPIIPEGPAGEFLTLVLEQADLGFTRRAASAGNGPE